MKKQNQLTGQQILFVPCCSCYWILYFIWLPLFAMPLPPFQLKVFPMYQSYTLRSISQVKSAHKARNHVERPFFFACIWTHIVVLPSVGMSRQSSCISARFVLVAHMFTDGEKANFGKQTWEITVHRWLAWDQFPWTFFPFFLWPAI